MHAALSICAALVARDQARLGGSSADPVHLDVAAVDGMLALMSLTIDEHLATGRAATPGGSLLSGRYACYDVYPTWVIGVRTKPWAAHSWVQQGTLLLDANPEQVCDYSPILAI